jgi:hypothetical protein
LVESESVRKWLDEIRQIQNNIRLGDRIHEWQETYSRLRDSLPSTAQLSLLKYDAINERLIYSRQELQRIWSDSLTNLRHFKLWAIQPFKLSRAVVRDFFLTTSFANTFREFSKLGTRVRNLPVDSI